MGNAKLQKKSANRALARVADFKDESFVRLFLDGLHIVNLLLTASHKNLQIRNLLIMRKIIFLRHPKLIWVSDSVKREEEKISSHPLAGDALCPADTGARTITHRAITLHFANAGTRAVAHRAIIVKLTYT